MPTSPFTRLAVTTTSLVLGAAATFIAAAPAHASPASGYLLSKSTGLNYSPSPFVALSGKPGSVVSFAYQVVNTGETANQYRIVLRPPESPAFGGIYVGSALVRSNVYYTPPVPSGKTFAFTIKISIPSGGSQVSYGGDLFLEDPSLPTFDPTSTDNHELDYATAVAVRAALGPGTTSQDLFLATGSQPRIGGSCCDPDPQAGVFLPTLSAATIKPGMADTFTLRVQNDSAAPSAIPLRTEGFPSVCPAIVTIRTGFADVTSAVVAGTYVTPVLAPGTHRDFTLTVRPSGCTTSAIFGWEQKFYTDLVGVLAHVPVTA